MFHSEQENYNGEMIFNFKFVFLISIIFFYFHKWNYKIIIMVYNDNQICLKI
jgi:hypothetical protein